MKNLCFVLFAFGMIVSSCSNRGQKNEEGSVLELKLSMDRVLDEVKLSAIASSVKCIPLETNDSVLIGPIARVIQSGEFMYVADRNALYKFANNGAVIASLQKSGPGADEYTAISDFQIAPDGTIWLLSQSNRTLYRYGMDNVLKEKISLDCWVSNICLVRPDKMLLYVGNEMDGGQGKQVLSLNLTTQKVADGYLPIDAKKGKYLHIRSRNYFSGGSQSLPGYFFQAFNDTVYKVSSDGVLSPFLRLNLADANIPASFFDVEYSDVMDFFQNLSKHPYAYGTNLFAELESCYLVSFYRSGECFFATLPKVKGESESVFKAIKEDSYLLGYTFDLNTSPFFVQKDNRLIIPLAVPELLTYIEDTFGEEEAAKFKTQFHIVSEDPNPMLLCVELKAP